MDRSTENQQQIELMKIRITNLERQLLKAMKIISEK